MPRKSERGFCEISEAGLVRWQLIGRSLLKAFFLMLKPVRRIHFMGVCGTAMGAVAAAVRDLGFVVSGSDENVYPPMSTFLAEKQILILAGYRPENVPDDVDLVVIGNAIFRGNPELESVLERKLLYRSLPETIKDFFLQGKRNVVVTGTHGKTTTTALVTWIFSEAGLNPGFLIGGIAKDLQRGASFPNSQYFILEGDEYDTAFFDKRSKFLHYLPETLLFRTASTSRRFKWRCGRFRVLLDDRRFAVRSMVLK